MPRTSIGRGAADMQGRVTDDGLPNRYRAFGLNIDSEIELPEMPTRADGERDVAIRYGAVPESIPDTVSRGRRHQLAKDEFLLHMEGVAGYWVRGPREVVVDPVPDAKASDVRVFLLASVMGAVIHANELLPLHASAVEVDGECVLFAGGAGFGKSTVAAACHARGYALLSDDVSVVSLDDGSRPLVHPGYRAIKLWADALEQVGRGLGEARLLRARLNKFSVGVPNGFATTPLPLRAVFAIAPAVSSRVALVPITGRQKVGTLLRETYRRRFLAGVGRRAASFSLVAAVAETTPVFSLARPHEFSGLAQLLDRLEEDGWLSGATVRPCARPSWQTPPRVSS